MADQLQLRGGTTSEHSTFTGALREVTVDIDKDTLVVHDNATAGGHPLAKENLSNVSGATAASKLANQTVAFSLGAAGTPSVTFDGDTNTGIYSPGADQLAISTGGNKRVEIQADGDIDIDNGGVFYDATNNRLAIGTTTPSALLHTAGNALFVNSGDNLDISLDSTYSTIIDAQLTGASEMFVLRTNRGIKFDTGGSTERARIDSSGRLLVGTSSDSNSSTVVLQGTSASTSDPAVLRLCRGVSNPADGTELGYVIFGDSGHSTAASIISARDGGTWTSGSSQPTRLVFSTTADGASSPTERMRLTSSGHFKATTGTTNTRYNNIYNHAIVNDTSNHWALVLNHTASLPYGMNIEYTNNAPNGNGNEFFACSDSSATRLYVKSNGGIANYSSNNQNLCDEREKKNIETLDSTWDCLKHWELKKFHYNEDADTAEKRYGVIAQQVKQYCPEVITDWTKQKAADAVLDEDGNVVTPAKEEIVRMGVKEQQMYWMAIKALQEAQVRIETLEAKVAALESA